MCTQLFGTLYDMETDDLGQRIEAARAASGDSVQNLCKALGIEREAYYQWRSGSTKNLKLVNALGLVKRYNLELEWLTTGEGPMYRYKHTLDRESLTTIVDAVDEFLKLVDRNMDATKKAMLIVDLYEDYTEDGVKPKKARIIQLLMRLS